MRSAFREGKRSAQAAFFAGRGESTPVPSERACFGILTADAPVGEAGDASPEHASAPMAEREPHRMRLLAQRSGRPLHGLGDARYRRLLLRMGFQFALVPLGPRDALASPGLLG